MIDPRLVFLARASARLILAEAGEIELHEATDISDRWKWIEALVARWDCTHPYREATTDIPRPASPESTVEAVMFSLRERGTKALEEPATKRRLSELSDQQLHEICGRLQRLNIAPAWAPEQITILVDAWNNCHG